MLDTRTELLRRMQGPQRHRLLHGYPLAAAVPPASQYAKTMELPFEQRPILVGVLPHPFCNPSVEGCGFCTFPHQLGNTHKTKSVAMAVAKEITDRFRRKFSKAIELVSSDALYFGGGTANLCDAEAFSQICSALVEWLSFHNGEVTLEGVPANFLKGQPRLMEIMQSIIPSRHYRISMGIQTFDETRLAMMGRSHFGNANTFEQVVSYAHECGFTASADLLFNLPGQSLDEMKDDVSRAIDTGFDHLGLYHLVLFPGLGTPWSQDETLLQQLPANDLACDNWVALREWAIEQGCVQTTLTNFETRPIAPPRRRFRYELLGFQGGHNMLGFGPGAFSYAASSNLGEGIKTINIASAPSYVEAIDSHGSATERLFYYTEYDQKVLWLTRRFAALEIDRDQYRRHFASDVLEDFGDVFAAACDQGLVETGVGGIWPTPKGMFYSDSIVSLLCKKAIRARSNLADELAVMSFLNARDNENAYAHM
jgi:coproporphyrinogen III oxidase-like Fe-S oxidoreductase